MSQNKANQYKAMSIKTANPGQILIMLYEAAIQNLKKAIACIDQNDIAGKGMHIGKTHDIINELNCTLNHEVGGSVTKELERLYNYMSSQLLKANMENDKAKIEEVRKLLDKLLEGWRGAVAEVQKGPNQKGQNQNGING